MNIKTRSSMPAKIKESNTLINGDSSLNSSEEERAFQIYYQEQIEKEDMECSSENELKMRTRWNSFRYSRKKTFIKINTEPLRGLKRVHSHQLNVGASSSSTVNKKIKIDVNENINKNDVSINPVDQFFQLEIQRLIASPAQYNFQPVCHVCEEFIDCVNIQRCTGVCLRYYHRSCLEYPPENPLPSNSIFQCPDCWTKTYSCILCRKTDNITSLLYCENSECGRLYHKQCLDKSNMAYSGLTKNSLKSCPAHFCATCSKEDPSTVEIPCNKLFQCIRCPMAFHDAELCMAAGAVELSLSHVVCPRHFEAALIKINSNKPIHTDWCFRCLKAGAKLVCHYCPGSYHHECVSTNKKNSETKETIFICGDCRNHRQPRYGEIVFVKAGYYRWWPCEVIHPRNAPMNILKLKRPDGTFPILFLGSQEYQWVTKSRTIYYNVAQLSPINKDTGGTHKMDREFSQGIKDAARMHTVFVNILMRRVPLKSISAESMTKTDLSRYIDHKDREKRTVKYKLIKTNVIVLPAKLPVKKNQSVCECQPLVCLRYQCKNGLSKIECDKDLCPAKDSCQNRPFTSHTSKSLGVNKTPNRGFGLKTTESLKQNEFIIEYVGEVITKADSAVRWSEAKRSNVRDFYMIRLSGDLIVDAGPKGNLSRFINHACDPNCRLERWIVNGYVRLGIFASKDIDPGDELTFDYRLSGVIMKEDIFCLCGTATCSGFLGPEKISMIGSPKLVTKNIIVEDQQSQSSPVMMMMDVRDNDSELEEMTESSLVMESTLSINIDSMRVCVEKQDLMNGDDHLPSITTVSPGPSSVAPPVNCAPDQSTIITIDLCDDQDEDDQVIKIPLVCRESPLREELAKLSSSPAHTVISQQTNEEPMFANNVDSGNKPRIKRRSVDSVTSISKVSDPGMDVAQIDESVGKSESLNGFVVPGNDAVVVKRRKIRRFMEPPMPEKLIELPSQSAITIKDSLMKVDLTKDSPVLEKLLKSSSQSGLIKESQKIVDHTKETPISEQASESPIIIKKDSPMKVGQINEHPVPEMNLKSPCLPGLIKRNFRKKVDNNKEPPISEKLSESPSQSGISKENSLKKVDLIKEPPISQKPSGSPSKSGLSKKDSPMKVDHKENSLKKVDLIKEPSISQKPSGSPSKSGLSKKDSPMKVDHKENSLKKVDLIKEPPISQKPSESPSKSGLSKKDSPMKVDQIKETPVPEKIFKIPNQSHHIKGDSPMKIDLIKLPPMPEKHSEFLSKKVSPTKVHHIKEPPGTEKLLKSLKQSNLTKRISPIKFDHIKEPPVQVKPLESPIQSGLSKKVSSMKVDHIKEYLLATDAAVEKSSKIFCIKDVKSTTDITAEMPAPQSNNCKGTNDCKDTSHVTKVDGSLETISRKNVAHESFCFRCFDGGELVLCDKQGCTKTYHLSCIGLRKAPSGTWYCPWHFCNVCGDPSTLFCVQCPGSYCQIHNVDDNILTPNTGSRLSFCHFHRHWRDKVDGESEH